MPYRVNAFRPEEAPVVLVDDDIEVGPVMFRATESTEARVPLVTFWFVGVFAVLGVVAGFAAWHR
jgi:hypothetical protein